MGEAAQLITALAALVTAIGGAVAIIIAALRSSGRQRVAAAQEAARLSRPSTARHRDDGFTDELGRAAVDLARDAAELARTARIDARLDALEHPETPFGPGDGGGAVA